MEDSSASASSPGSPTSRPNRPGAIYHVSSQARIDEILETARRRSVAMESGQPFPMPLSPTQTARLSEHEGEGTESSADEHTAIVRPQSSKRSNYQSTSSSLATGNNKPAVKKRSTQERRPQQPAPEESDTDGQQPWWKKQVEKIGSIELENKGSVARDHLALGRFHAVPFLLRRAIYTNWTNRTHILGMASNFTCVCFNRHSSHSVIPSKYYYLKLWL